MASAVSVHVIVANSLHRLSHSAADGKSVSSLSSSLPLLMISIIARRNYVVIRFCYQICLHRHFLNPGDYYTICPAAGY